MWIVSGTSQKTSYRCRALTGTLSGSARRSIPIPQDLVLALLWSPHTSMRMIFSPMYIPCFMKTVMPSMSRELIGIIALRPLKAALQWACTSPSHASLKTTSGTLKHLPSRSFSSCASISPVSSHALPRSSSSRQPTRYSQVLSVRKPTSSPIRFIFLSAMKLSRHFLREK